jgi:hypothetical protein
MPDASQTAAVDELALGVDQDSCMATAVENLMHGTVSGGRVIVFDLRAYSSFASGESENQAAPYQTGGIGECAGGRQLPLLGVDVEGWSAELLSIKEHFDSFGSRLPDELRDELKALESRLRAAKV